MKIFITADTHFGHQNLVKWKHRPDNFESLILNNWFKYINGEDMLIHLGDVYIGCEDRIREYIKLVKGFQCKKILTLGNHDERHSIKWFVERGFDFICDNFILNIYGKRIVFSHRPLDITHRKDVDLNIHGHSHGNAHRDNEHSAFYSDRHIQIALEGTGYKPISLKTLIKQWEKARKLFLNLFFLPL